MHFSPNANLFLFFFALATKKKSSVAASDHIGFIVDARYRFNGHAFKRWGIFLLAKTCTVVSGVNLVTNLRVGDDRK